MGNGQSRSPCGEAQWWVMLPGVHPCLPAPTLHKGSLGTVPPVPAAGDAGDPVEREPRIPQHQPTKRVPATAETPSSHLVPGLHLQWLDAAPAFSPPVVHTGWHPGTTGLWKYMMTSGLSDGDLTTHHFILGSTASLPSDSLMFDLHLISSVLGSTVKPHLLSEPED